jgi:hypothetical protein
VYLVWASGPLINSLAIDNLAKDFQLEPIQQANLHALVKVIHVYQPSCAITWGYSAFTDGIS